MTEGFKGFSTSENNKELKLYIRNEAIKKIIKDYKKFKKYEKSSIHEIEKLSGKKTKIDKLIDEYGIDPEALE